MTQWQAIPVATQVNPVNPAISERQPGGVIDFDRDYAGLDARLVWRWALAGERGAQLVAGATFDDSQEDRRGYENFTGSGADQVLGVTGKLRRDETNRVVAESAYAQGEIEIDPRWVATLGVRSGRVEFRSSDHYIVGGNLDDSGSQSYRFTNPVAALQWRASEALNLYVSAGRGYESPTFNELAYRPDGSAGFNTELKGQSSTQLELGAKWRAAALGLSLDAAIFDARTQDEIGVATNRGGRATFTNVDDTKRQGAEIDLRWRIAAGLARSAGRHLAVGHLRQRFLRLPRRALPHARRAGAGRQPHRRHGGPQRLCRTGVDTRSGRIRRSKCAARAARR